MNRSEDRQGTALPASNPNSTEHLTSRLILGNFGNDPSVESTETPVLH